MATDPDSVERDERRFMRQRRADAALEAIQQGADPVAEAFRLANDYSDEQAGRFTSWWRRRRESRPDRGD
jgi:hypothetical protein